MGMQGWGWVLGCIPSKGDWHCPGKGWGLQQLGTGLDAPTAELGFGTCTPKAKEGCGGVGTGLGHTGLPMRSIKGP